MKKKIYSIAMILVLMIASLVVTACGKHEPEKIEIKTDSIERSVVIGNDHDLSGLVIKVTYTDDEVEEHTKNDDMNITPIDTTTLGEKTLTVEYLGLTATLTIEVVATDGDQYDILGFEKPQTYTFYEANKAGAVASIAGTNDSEFCLGDNPNTTEDENPYFVGDDNPFKFLPIITGIHKETGDTKDITAYTSKVTVKENGVELTGTALTNVVSINNTESTFDFTDAAVDAENPRTFEITVEPEDVPEDATYSPITIKVTVVDGWNIHLNEEEQLSRIDNCANSASVWADFKNTHNIGNEDINAVVLHGDMLITKDDIPTGFIWNEGAYAGSLKDEISLYTRDIDVDDTFSIYGNYFTIKIDPAFPQVEYFTRDGSGFAHSALFSFGGDNLYRPNDCTSQGSAVLRNVSLFGNGERKQESVGEYYGSLTGIITSAKSTTLENCLTRAFVTHIIALGEIAQTLIPETTCTISNTKMIDSFSTMFFAWASQENNIINSFLTKAGGSLVMATHVGPENSAFNVQGVSQSYANINVKDSLLENYVMGNEAWFTVSKASGIITFLKAIGGLMQIATEDFSNISVTDENDPNNYLKLSGVSAFVNEQGYLNFLTSNLADDNVINTDPISNKITIEKNNQVVNYQDMLDPTIASLGALTAMPIFKAGDMYVTLDLTTFNPENTDSNGLPVITDAKLALILSPEIMSQYEIPFMNIGGGQYVPLVSIDVDTLSSLNPAAKAVVGTALHQFFESDYVNLFYGGSCLGASFGMHHSEISSN